jgi:S-formylglutathione hydrolase FrmB
MGGFGAFNLGIKYREEFGAIVGIMPPVNLRYGDYRGRYLTPYEPGNWTLRETDRPNEIIGRFYHVILIRARRMTDPVIGRHYPDPTGFIAAENPMEMLAAYDVKPDEFAMFIGYGTKDEFNLAAQVESFLEVAAARGIRPDVVVIPDGRHNVKTALAMFPDFSRWVSGQLAAYVPPGYVPTTIPIVTPLATERRKPLLGLFPRP